MDDHHPLYVSASCPSKDNRPQDLIPPSGYGSGMTSCNKRKNDINTLTSSPSSKRHQTESSRTDMEIDVNMDRSSDTEMAEKEDDDVDKLRSLTRKEEIQILNQMIAFNDKYHRFPDSGCEHDLNEFCTAWLKISVDCHDVLLDKMKELHARFKNNYNKFDNEFPPMGAWMS